MPLGRRRTPESPVRRGRGRLRPGLFLLRMLPGHASRGQDAMFRLKRNASAATTAFLAGQLQDTVVGIHPDRRALAQLKARHPGAAFGPLEPRLVRYTAGDTVFALGTTLQDGDGFTVDDLAGPCHSRWRTGSVTGP